MAAAFVLALLAVGFLIAALVADRFPHITCLSRLADRWFPEG